MKYSFKNILLILFIAFSLSGLWASFVITLEKNELLRNPDYIPPCSINPLFNCKNVMSTPYAEMFGFPNTIIGLVGYSVMITVGVFMLFNEKLNRKLLVGANIGAFTAFVFSYLLTWISMYKIGSLCPFCLISCFSATNLFFCLTLVNLKDNVFNLKEGLNVKIQSLINKKAYIWIILGFYGLVFLWMYLKFPTILEF